MNIPLHTIQDVETAQLCCGCGGCAGVAPSRYEMVDVPQEGRRPRLRSGYDPDPEGDAGAMAVCPGHRLRHAFDESDPELDRSLRATWGPVYEVWEGWATDESIRFAGSSGGAATALSLWAIERDSMHAVLHTAADPDSPYLNKTVMSTNREELLVSAGSRYAPASPCEGLPRIAAAPGPCVFIGKPCDVAAVQSARRQDPSLDQNIGLIIAFFCAGTPSSAATLDLMHKVGVPDPAATTGVRYRGNGWPGKWTVTWRSEGVEHEASLTYEESWGFLQAYRQWRCYICPDHTGEFADIAVGDPWYRDATLGDPGRSLLIARTKRGVEALHKAAAAGYITLSTRDHTLLPRSQPNLARSRGRLWGQLLALRVTSTPSPKYSGFPQFCRFLCLPLSTMLRSLLRTTHHRRRITTRARDHQVSGRTL